MLRELGGRFVEAQVIEQPDDIFWLEIEEIEQMVAGVERGDTLDAMVEHVQPPQSVLGCCQARHAATDAATQEARDGHQNGRSRRRNW